MPQPSLTQFTPPGCMGCGRLDGRLHEAAGRGDIGDERTLFRVHADPDCVVRAIPAIVGWLVRNRGLTPGEEVPQ